MLCFYKNKIQILFSGGVTLNEVTFILHKQLFKVQDRTRYHPMDDNG
jgi:hypothetical protein